MVEEQLIMKDLTIIVKSLINSGHSALASATCLVVPAEILLHSPAACFAPRGVNHMILFCFCV